MWHHGLKLFLLLLFLVGIFLWIVKAPIASFYLTRKVGVPISLSSIHLGLAETVVSRFRVKNPWGFTTKTAFQAEEMQFSYKLRELFGSPVVFDRIHLDKVYLSLEMKTAAKTESNWGAISHRIPKRRGRTGVLIHELLLTDVTVEILGLDGQSSKKEKLDKISLQEVNSQKGFPTEAVLLQIFEEVGLSDFLKETLSPEGFFEKILDPI